MTTTSPGTSRIPMPGALQYGEVIAWLSQNLPEDAIVTNGAGNFASWLHRHFQYKGWRTQLAPTSGSMGYSVPAAVAAKIAAPERTVVAIAGDGEFLMNGQEFATADAVRRGDHRAGGEQRHVRHDPHAPGARVPGPRVGHRAGESGFRRLCARLRRPRRDGGAHRGLRARVPARRWPPASRRSSNCSIDPEAITPSATLSGLRAAALAKK